MKHQPSIVTEHANAKGTAAGFCSLSFYVMKKLTAFILILLLLIISEYFLLNELLSRNVRIGMVLLSLLSTIVFVIVVVRFFKKYILPIKHS